MKTKTCPTEHDLSQFDLGNLAGERYEEVSQHLESCTECARKFETLQVKADALIDDLRRELPSGALEEDSEVRRLISAAAALENTSLAAEAETHSSKQTRLKPSHAQLAAQLLTPPQADDELGRLGGYRVLEVLGAGGMGVVFKAEDPALKRLVAMKAILPNVAEASANARERFLREARTTASIQHDNIVTIYQVGQDRDVAFLAMQLLEGEALSKRLAREPRLPIVDVLQIARETAQGLAAAHAKGLTHRDIKPDNLWLEGSRLAPRDESGSGEDVPSTGDVEGQENVGSHDRVHVAERQGYRIKILDFGLARAADDGQDLTHSGMVVGTPSYLAPEQARGEKVDARADLFSLGVVIYQMLTGSKPFARESLTGTLLAIINDTPRPITEFRSDTPAALIDLVNRLVAKDAAERPSSASEVVRAIRALEADLKSGISKFRSEISNRTSLLSTEPLTPGPSPARGEGSYRTPAVQPASRTSPPPSRIGIAVAIGGLALALLAGIIVIIRNKDGKEIARVEAPDGSTAEIKSTDPLTPAAAIPTTPATTAPAAAPTASQEYLPPMSPLALVQRPAKLVAKEGGEAVESWTIVPAPLVEAGSQQYALRGDGQRLAAFGEDAIVRVWNVPSKRLVQALEGHTAGPTSKGRNSRWFAAMAWQPKGSLLATASKDGSLRVWEADKGTTSFVPSGGARNVSFVAWSPDGRRLAAAFNDKTVRCWNASDWKALKPVDGLTGTPVSLVWSPDSTTLAICAGTCTLVTPADGGLRVVPGVTLRSGSNSPQVRFSPDGQSLAHFAGSQVLIRDAASLKTSALLSAPVKDSPAKDFAWSPDGKQMLVVWSVGGQSRPVIHDAMKGEVTQSLEAAYKQMSTEQSHPVEWLPDGRTIVVNRTFIDLPTAAETETLSSSNDRFLEWSDDGTLLLTEGLEHQPQVWRHRPGEKREPFFVGFKNSSSPTRHSLVWSPMGSISSMMESS